MKYVIFGAGKIGSYAYGSLGAWQVAYFADSYHYGYEMYGKRVRSFQEMADDYRSSQDMVVVIATSRYQETMAEQLRKAGIERYFIYDVYMERDPLGAYDKGLPVYYLYRQRVQMTYAQILSGYDIAGYRKIAIYGTNYYIHHLICAIMKQAPGAEISIVEEGIREGRYFDLGCRHMAFREAVDSCDCMVLNVRTVEDDIRHTIGQCYREKFRIVDMFQIEHLEKRFFHPELERYKGIHEGKRMFIIGNGPSLNVRDLDTLHKHHELCMAFNKIYRVYDKTEWRADYIGMSDPNVIENYMTDNPELPGELFVYDNYHRKVQNPYREGIPYIHGIMEAYYPNYPQFSDDITKGFFWGSTVTYDIGFQFAAYMGIKEIYLIGVDHSYQGHPSEKGNHFIDDYITEEEASMYKSAVFEKEKLTKAYEKAELYSRQNGFRIYNATRGGELEVFERVDFDCLFPET